MAYFTLKVNSENTDNIDFKIAGEEKELTSVQFNMNTLDDSVKSRAKGIRAEFIIKGIINDKTKSEVQKLAAWAIATEEEELYRSINVLVKNGSGETAKVLRRYEFSDMFVLDYIELFPEENASDSIGKFELFIAQKVGGLTRKVLPN